MIVLPWPDKGLSPNARLHYRKVASLKAAARVNAAWHVIEAMTLEARKAVGEGEGPIPLTIRFYPPDNRLRDDDNAISSFKAARDGIAEGLGVNDRRFQPTYQFCTPEKPGRVEVHFG